jgi:glycosyltransferase involved in cell wall biosynthesis
MREDVLVTVVCTCFNHQKYVIESLQSVLNQSYKNIQLIVVDDYSTDNSIAVIEDFIKNFREIQFIKNKINLGLTKSVNHAMTFAKGDFFIDLSADDILLPNCVEVQLETFRKSNFENLAIVYGNVALITENGNHKGFYFETNDDLKVKTVKKSGDIYAEIISMKTTICSVAAMYKKTIFDQYNGYDENLTYEDLDFWLRVSRDCTIQFIDQVLVQKRTVQNSLQTKLYAKKNRNSISTFLILKKAYRLNRTKTEHYILRKRVNFEIINAFRNKNYILMTQNCWLRLKVGIKSI